MGSPSPVPFTGAHSWRPWSKRAQVRCSSPRQWLLNSSCRTTLWRALGIGTFLTRHIGLSLSPAISGGCQPCGSVLPITTASFNSPCLERTLTPLAVFPTRTTNSRPWRGLILAHIWLVEDLPFCCVCLEGEKMSVSKDSGTNEENANY